MFTLALFPLACAAAGGPPAGDSVQIGQYVSVPSARLGRDQAILVALPASHGTGVEGYPVVYLLNGQDVNRFANLASMIAIEAEAGKLPEMIVVGVDTRQDYAKHMFPVEVAGWPGSGGSDVFVEFLETELVPFVEQRYGAGRFRVLLGPSNAGLLAVYALLAAPDTFPNVVAVSPSIGWCTDFIVGRLRSFERPPGASLNLFMVRGSHDFADIVTPGIEALAKELSEAEIEGLRWSSVTLQGEGHVPLRGFEEGLSLLFADHRFPRDAYGHLGLDGVVRHYDALSERYGFAVAIPAALLEDIGNGHMQREEWSQAVDVYDLWAREDPGNPLPRYLLAASCRSAGDGERARRSCLAALEIDPGFAPARSLLEAIEQD